MSKVKSKAKEAKVPDVLSKVKDAGITKPQAIKAKSKELAKQVAKKARDPSPSSESDSDASSGSEPVMNGKGTLHDESDSDSASSDSSESSDEETAPVNGHIKNAKHTDSESAESSDEDSQDEKVLKPAETADSESEELENDTDESEIEDKKPKDSKAPVKKAKVDSSEDDSDSASDESSDNEESDKEVEVKVAPPKRKVEEPVIPSGKKAKLDESNGKGSNLFVGNLSWNIDEAWLKEEFEAFGELSGVRIIMDRTSGRSKGFGYVDFVNASDAAKAHSEMSGRELDGRKLNVDFSNGPTNQPNRVQSRAKSFGDVQSPPSDTLFIGNLSFDAGQDAISTAFGEYGTILGVRLPTDRESGQPKGYGYVTFSSVDEAKVALESMQGIQIEGRPVRLDFSQPRPERSDSFRGGRGGFGGFGGRGERGGRGGRGRGGFDRGRGGRPNTTNRGGFGDFSGRKTTF